MNTKLLKKVGKSLLIGSFAGLAIALVTNFFVADLIDRIEDQTYYMRYHWEFDDHSAHAKQGLTNARNADYGINIIDIDDRSQHKLGTYWNWDRSYHAEMLNSLSKHYPAAVMFDVMFFDPEDQNHIDRFEKLLAHAQSNNPGMKLLPKTEQQIASSINYDKQFVDATAQAGCVYHALCMTDTTDYPDYALSQIQSKRTMAWHDSLHPTSAITLPVNTRKALRDNKPVIDGTFPALARAARDIGFVNIPKNSDGVIREIPLLYGFDHNAPVYLPLSVRMAATLFGTPNKEIVFEPGKYIDIGKPFKIFKDSSGQLVFSYPNVSKEFVHLLIDRAKDILALKPGSSIDISSLCALGKDSLNRPFIDMYCGSLPPSITAALLASNIQALLSLPVDSSCTLGTDIQITRSSNAEWMLTAPVGEQEWMLSRVDLQTLARVPHEAYASIAKGQKKLLFYAMTVTNTTDGLVSSLPILRGETLKELCLTQWCAVEKMQPNSRMDFGNTVRIPIDKNNRHIVTYFGHKAQPFSYYSYYDILKDRVQGTLDGKIFIVGSSIPGMFDIVSAPVDNAYPGVEIHASLLNSFLTNTFMTRLSAVQDFCILLLIGILIGCISFLLKPLWSGILTITIIFIYFVIALTVFNNNHLWIEIARPVLDIVLTFTAVMAFRYITEEKDRKFLQHTFKQYLSPELIDIMYTKKQTPKLGGEEGVRTAFFTDIQGFSTFSEKLGSPTRLVELLNEYLTVMTDSLLSHFGTLDKYEGDAIIAFFGAPMYMENHAHQACSTALDMQAKLAQLREKWTNEGSRWPEIVHGMRMRIGINTGTITTGNMGSAVRMNYTMMGDAVNLAARLESAAKQYGVFTVISNFTEALVHDSFETRELDTITVVGKSEPIKLFELLANKGGLSTDIQKLLEVYNKGLACYYAQQWDDAIALFTTSSTMEPYAAVTNGKSPSSVLLKRCESYKVNQPGDNWNGVYSLTSK